MSDMIGKKTILIDAPVTKIYDYVADFPKHCEWNDGLVQMKRVTNGPIAVGSQFQTEEKVPDDIPAVMKMMMPVMNRIILTYLPRNKLVASIWMIFKMK